MINKEPETTVPFQDTSGGYVRDKIIVFVGHGIPPYLRATIEHVTKQKNLPIMEITSDQLGEFSNAIKIDERPIDYVSLIKTDHEELPIIKHKGAQWKRRKFPWSNR